MKAEFWFVTIDRPQALDTIIEFERKKEDRLEILLLFQDEKLVTTDSVVVFT